MNFSASAEDDVDGAITPSCDPASGSTFPLGHTSVMCTATDAAGNSSGASFAVNVVDTTPPDLTVPADITWSVRLREAHPPATPLSRRSSAGPPPPTSSMRIQVLRTMRRLCARWATRCSPLRQPTPRAMPARARQRSPWRTPRRQSSSAFLPTPATVLNVKCSYEQSGALHVWWTPSAAASDHAVEDEQQLAHACRQGYLGGLACGT